MRQLHRLPLNQQPVNWDWDNNSNETHTMPGVNVDTNDTLNDFPGCANTTDDDELSGFDDWSHISLAFQHFRDSADAAITPTTEPEPTLEDLQRLQTSLNTADLSVSASANSQSALVGYVITLTLTTQNHGYNPTDSAAILINLPSGLTYLPTHEQCSYAQTDNKLTCPFGHLPVNDVRGVSIRALVNLNATDHLGRNMITVTASSLNQAGPDPNANNDTVQIPLAVVNYRDKAGTQLLYAFEEGYGGDVYDASGLSELVHIKAVEASRFKWISGGIVFHLPTLTASAMPVAKLVNAARMSNELSIEAWIKPANLTQTGPACAICFGDATNNNFMLGQGRPSLPNADLIEARLRTTATDDGGNPGLLTPNGTLSTTLTHIIFTRDAGGRTRIYVNGQKRTERLISGDFSNWDQSFRLALGNDLAGNSPWLGEYHLVAIYNRALTQTDVWRNYFAGPSGDRPVTTLTLPTLLR